MKDTPRTALVVEDNPGDVLLLRVFLSDARAGGMRIVPVETLAGAVEAAAAETVDVVLLDLSLPDSAGVETLERFRKRFPDLPVIVLTASDDAQVAVAALRAGASDYLVKGHYDGQALLRSIRLAIESGRAERMRRDLAESEERYRLLFEQSPAGLLRARFDVATYDGEHVEGNTAYATMLGYGSRDEVVGLVLSETFCCEKGWRAFAERLVADGSVANIEVELRRADGTRTWALANAVLRRPDGAAEATIEAALLDVTERRLAEQALRASERRFAAVFSSSPFPMVITRLSDRTIVGVNDSFERYFAMSAAEVTGRTTAEIGLWDSPASRDDLIGRIDEEGTVRDFETKLRSAAGEVRSMLVSAAKISLDGEPCLVAAAVDITDRKEAEAALRASESRLHAIVDHSPAAIVMKDLEGRYLLINRAAAEFMRRPPEECLGKTDEELVPAMAARLFRESDRRALEAGHAVEIEDSVTNGEAAFTYVGQKFPLADASGRPYAVAAIASDVTERRQLEEQLRRSQRMEAIGRLAGGVAHDFNNMLTVINGYADLLMRRVSAHDPLYADLEEVRRAGQKAATVTRQLLAFSRQQVLMPRVLDLAAVVADLGKMLGRLLGEDVEMVVDAVPGLWHVKADPGQIEQAIVNLAVNARDAMPAGGRLTIRMRNATLDAPRKLGITRIPAGEWVTLEIEDTGCGMDEETVARAFEPFFTTKEQGKGTGLGLATVYGIVKQSEGFIEVESEDGKGTHFTIYLPRVAEAAVPVESLGEEEHVAGGHETVLLVEDEPAVRRLGAASLRAAGFRVLEAADGGEAMLICEQHDGTIDLLLTDVVMPRMNGPQVVERLRSIRPAMKVLYVSGYADDALQSHGISDAGAAFLPKPFGPDALVAKVREVLDTHPRLRGKAGDAYS